MAHSQNSRRGPHLPPKRDYTTLPDDDRPDPEDLIRTVDVNSPAPPGTEFEQAAWVNRYS